MSNALHFARAHVVAQGGTGVAGSPGLRSRKVARLRR